MEKRSMTRILVVDDEPNLIELLRGYLQQEGYDVVVAGDGPARVPRAQERQLDLGIPYSMLPRFDRVEARPPVRRVPGPHLPLLTPPPPGRHNDVGLTLHR